MRYTQAIHIFGIGLFLYLCDMEVPKAIIEAAGEFVTQYGANFEYLGEYEGSDAWVFLFPEDENIGYPFVYLFKDGKADEVSGMFALDIIASFEGE